MGTDAGSEDSRIGTEARSEDSGVEERTQGLPPTTDPRASIESFATLFEAIAEGMAIVEDGRIVIANRTFAAILGRESAALIGVEALDFIAPPFRMRAVERRLSEYQHPVELEIERPDGTTIPVQMIARSIRYDGRAVWLITVQDISERRRAEEALRASEARFRALVQHSSDVTIIRDLDGTIRYLSPAAEEVFGYTLTELIGRNRAELIHPDDFRAIAASVARIQAEPGVHAPIEYRVRRRDGSWRFLEGTATNLLAEQGIRGIVVNARDITERKLAERERDALLQREQEARREAEAAVRARDEFLTIAAHELKTPLTVVKGNAEMLARQLERPTPDPERVRRLTARVRTQLDHFGEMINDLLDLSRLRHDQLALRKQSLDLAALAARVLDRFQVAAVDGGKHSLILDAPRPVVASVNESRIEQVLTNLIGNAIKYSPAGGEVRVEVQAEEHWACLRVSDQGLGIPLAEQERIFEPFTRTSAAIAAANGMGIGLYVTSQIVAAHSGTIVVVSEPERGSCFTVRLPLGSR
ncbi:MAG: diguanylate cyclase/phosphodiesterase (GGDEF & EAL domains) with PAS/PAC sensor(s) [uncultured Thermomicrobiales bacterium]|uniref:histidine kinase n=1 Tax=uncultured Thermomicrobiales bacterium TaxID=1645740 RepID=A0A6J4VP45_9BACT|nr:MAG: diguanylate cyclase/phosphodiesterase (GGDEF & EAL domains) with PAS/PAC sensor(s) [uncultured Thermomicrobiales bacterium]